MNKFTIKSKTKQNAHFVMRNKIILLRYWSLKFWSHILNSIYSHGAMTLKDFSKWSGIGITKIYSERNSGKLKFTKIGRKTLILRFDAEKWLQSYCSQKEQ